MPFMRQINPLFWMIALGFLPFLPTGKAQTPNEIQPHIPDTPAGRILSRWIEAHNRGEEASLRSFVERAYSPSLLAKVDVESHLEFYLNAVPMFGKLKQMPYRIIVNEPRTLIVELLNATLKGPEQLTAENRVLVEIDMDPDHPEYLARGLGLGSVACAQRK